MWLRRLFLALMLLLFIVLQVALVPKLSGWLRHLDLALVFTVTTALIFGAWHGAAFGAVTGLLLDIAAGSSLGFYAFPLFVVGYFVGGASRLVYKDTVFIPFLVGTVSAAGYLTLLWLLAGFVFHFWLAGAYWTVVPRSVVVNGLSVPVSYAVFVRAFGKKETL